MRVLITGGAGFIGSHLVDHYLAEQHEITVLDNLSTGSIKNLNNSISSINFIESDIRNSDLVSKLVENTDLVIHMAAALGVNNILNSTVESISTNFSGSEVVLNAAVNHEKRIIIASTSEIYGKNPKQPLSETDDRVVGTPQLVRWSYSDAKALEEAVAHSLFLKSNLQVTTLRLFNTVGPRQTGQYGMVIPRFVKSALKNQALQVYGDGTQSRVFCHISDVIDAITKVAKRNDAVGQVFNLGGVGEISILELANQTIQITNSSSKVEFIPYEVAYSAGFEDMQRRVPDISKISNFLNWSPKRNLNSIIEDVKEHFINLG